MTDLNDELYLFGKLLKRILNSKSMVWPKAYFCYDMDNLKQFEVNITIDKKTYQSSGLQLQNCVWDYASSKDTHFHLIIAEYRSKIDSSESRIIAQFLETDLKNQDTLNLDMKDFHAELQESGQQKHIGIKMTNGTCKYWSKDWYWIQQTWNNCTADFKLTYKTGATTKSWSLPPKNEMQ